MGALITELLHGGLLVVDFLLFTGTLLWGARWAPIPNVTFTKALAAWLVRWIVGLPLMLVGRIVLGHHSVWIDAAALIVATCLVIKCVLRTSVPLAIRASLPTIAGMAVLTLFVLTVFRPYLATAYSIPTNAMAPTVLGDHCEGKCPRCGAVAYFSPSAIEYRGEGRSDEILAICSVELQSCVVIDYSPQVVRGDRILVNKLLTPRRWDLITFQYPEDPKTIFMKRLVGLPGEKLFIDEGAVWINDQKLTPPPPWEALQYVSHLDSFPEMNGTRSKPAQLGPDEYFVLGDFSGASADSRLWRRGAPGHPPYAVPASYLDGVVTDIYWPPSRIRTFR